MTRSEFIQRATLALLTRQTAAHSITDAVATADALEKSGKAPWSDPNEGEKDAAGLARGETETIASYERGLADCVKTLREMAAEFRNKTPVDPRSIRDGSLLEVAAETLEAKARTDDTISGTGG